MAGLRARYVTQVTWADWPGTSNTNCDLTSLLLASKNPTSTLQVLGGFVPSIIRSLVDKSE